MVALLRSLLGSALSGWRDVVSDALLSALTAGLQAPTLSAEQLAAVAPAAAAVLGRPLGPVRIEQTGAITVESAEGSAAWVGSRSLGAALPASETTGDAEQAGAAAFRSSSNSRSSGDGGTESRASALESEGGDVVEGDGATAATASPYGALRSALAALAVLGGYAEPLRPGAVVEVSSALLQQSQRSCDDSTSPFSDFLGRPGGGGGNPSAPIAINTVADLTTVAESLHAFAGSQVPGRGAGVDTSGTAAPLRFELSATFNNTMRQPPSTWISPGTGPSIGSATFTLPAEALQAVSRVPVPIGALSPTLWRAVGDAASAWGLADHMALPEVAGADVGTGPTVPLYGGFSTKLSHSEFSISPGGVLVETNNHSGRAVIDCPMNAGVWTWDMRLVKVRLVPRLTRARHAPNVSFFLFIPAGRPGSGDDVLRGRGPPRRRRWVQVEQLLDVPLVQRVPVRKRESICGSTLSLCSSRRYIINCPTSALIHPLSLPAPRARRSGAGSPRSTPATS